MVFRRFKKLFSYGIFVVSTGFAMFCMFFGSGNLIFPLLVGHMVPESYPAATLGLCITGVALPFLGLFAISLFRGSYKLFFARFDRVSSFIIPLIILLLLGPVAVIPRCITVGCGSLGALWEDSSIVLLSALYCIGIFLSILDKRKIIPLLGSVLTPLLLFSFALIIYYGIKASTFETPLANTTTGFVVGLNQGYQFMDLLASFFFASTIVSYMKQRLAHQVISAKRKKLMILASLIIGASFLAIIYGFLVYLGAAYAPLLSFETAEQSLSIIAHHTLGVYAGPVVSLAVFLACFTTAMVLTEISSEFFHERVFQRKIPLPVVVGLVLMFSFLFSNLKFAGITMLLSPILKAIYPALVVFTVVNIAHKLYGFKPLKRPVYITLVLTLILMLTGLLPS